MYRRMFLSLAVVGGICATAYANPTITPGNWSLLPDTKGQQVTVFVSGDDGVSDVNLALSVDDGNSGPFIQSVDLYQTVGLVFNLNNSGVQGEGVTLPDQVSYSGITTLSSTVVAGNGAGGNKALAIVTIDTTGLFAGSWDFLAEIPSSQLVSDFAGEGFPNPILVAGSLSIEGIPEPSSFVLAMFAAAGLCAVAIRRRRKSA